MARPTAPMIVWRMGEHSFFLNIAELRALEDGCDAGVTLIWQRMIAGAFKINDVFHTLRLGLIGGGMKTTEALKMVNAAFDEANLYTLAATAQTVLSISILWDDTVTPTGKT
jgi:hypothetical protein